VEVVALVCLLAQVPLEPHTVAVQEACFKAINTQLFKALPMW
jgi:hypothetical protein